MIENKIQTEVKKSRRGLPRHTKTHFLMIKIYIQKLSVRHITTGKDRLALVNENTGEQVGNGGFFQAMEVDKTRFVKLYVDGVSAIEGLLLLVRKSSRFFILLSGIIKTLIPF